MNKLFLISLIATSIIIIFASILNTYLILLLTIPFLYLQFLFFYGLFDTFRHKVLNKYGKTVTAIVTDIKPCSSADDGGFWIYFKYTVNKKTYFKRLIDDYHWEEPKNYRPFFIGRKFIVKYLFLPGLFKEYDTDIQL